MNYRFSALVLYALAVMMPGPPANRPPGVTASALGRAVPEMRQADFWIAGLRDPDRVVMSPERIAAFNEETRKNLPDKVYDLTAYPPSLTGGKLAGLVGERHFPGKPVYRNGQPVSSSFFESLQREINIAGIREENPVCYAFTVRRTSLRTFPTHDLVTRTPGNREFDLIQETAVDPAEPVLVLHTGLDGRWCFIQTYNYRGWAPVCALAFSENRKTWLDYVNAGNYLVVTGSKCRLGVNPFTPEFSELEFAMGAKLPLVRKEDVPEVVGNQSPEGNYVIKLPVRGRNGELYFEPALVPLGCDVSPGYLPFTRANIIRQAFKMKGERYGWGGMFKSRDCSALVLDLYRSFGFRMPRNADEQEQTAGKTVVLGAAGAGERTRLLGKLRSGATLHFPGHVMLYLGAHGGRYYVIHAIAACGDVKKQNPDGSPGRIPLNGVIVTDLSLPRVNGKTLLESLTVAKQIE